MPTDKKKGGPLPGDVEAIKVMLGLGLGGWRAAGLTESGMDPVLSAADPPQLLGPS